MAGIGKGLSARNQLLGWLMGNGREAQMAVIERDENGVPKVWCDPEIVDLVRALNAGDVKTVASCSGHGVRPGNIALKDGRELIIAPDYETARLIEGYFPGVNGEPAPNIQELLKLCAEADELRASLDSLRKEWSHD